MAFKGHSVDSTSCLGRRDVCFRCVGLRGRQRENMKGGRNGVIYMSVHHSVKIISAEEKLFCLERREGIQNFFCLVFLKESDNFLPVLDCTL